MTETISNSALPGSIVTTEWLAAQLGDPRVRVVDIRGYVKSIDLGGGHQRADYLGARDEYEAGHIPGSVYVDWTRDIIDPDDPVPAQIAPPESFAATMGGLGIGNETAVVAVDHTGGHFAGRLWWALKYHGHDAVAVLDGGWNAWARAGLPVTTDPPAIAPATFVPSLRPELRVEVDDVTRIVESGGAVIVDARDEPTYRGEVWRGARKGHIPGAISLPAKSLVNADGTWKPDDELAELVSAAGITRETPVIAYCNGGVTATGVLFALDRLGFTTWANYDGSWNEWGARADLAVEEG